MAHVDRLQRFPVVRPLTRRLGRGTLVALLLLGVAVSPSAATNFLVVTPSDGGAGSLRAAIDAANLGFAGAPHQISFNIPGIGVHTIPLLTPLPDLFVEVTIDGFTQPGAVANTLPIGNNAVYLVEIDGSNLAPNTSGLVLRGNDSVVRGLVINGLPGDFSAAVLIRGARGVVEGCFLGTDPSGTVAMGNGEGVADIGIVGGHRVGGPLPSQRNLISGHRNRAVVLAGPGVVVQGNYVGTDRTGTVPLTPDGAGVFIFAGGNATGANGRIGGPNPGEGNVISGLAPVGGVVIFGLATGLTTDIVIQGNLIGTDPTGTLAVPSQGSGVIVNRAVRTVIGGPGPGEGNVVANQRIGGIFINLGADETRIQGNLIGVAIDRTTPMPNGLGIQLSDSSDCTIGGTAPGEGNVVAWSSGAAGTGIRLAPGLLDALPTERNAILGNSIYGSAMLGIDLLLEPFVGPETGEGPTANDPFDLDVGTNQLQNAPAIDQVTDNGATFRFEGTLDSAANSDYRIELFASSACHPSGYGEARTLLGFVDVSTDGVGFSPLVVDLPAPPAGENAFTATATDANGNTSELSRCLGGVAEIPLLDSVGLAALTVALLLAGWTALRRARNAPPIER